MRARMNTEIIPGLTASQGVTAFTDGYAYAVLLTSTGFSYRPAAWMCPRLSS